MSDSSSGRDFFEADGMTSSDIEINIGSSMSISSVDTSSSDEEDGYGRLMEVLRRQDRICRKLSIESTGIFLLILDRIDEFCNALSSNKETILVLKICDVYQYRMPTLEITEEKSSAWNEFFEAIHNLHNIKRLDIGICSLSCEIVRRFLESLPTAKCLLALHFLWFTANDYDTSALIQVLSNQQCEKILLYVKVEDFESDEQERVAVSATGASNHFADKGLVSRMLDHVHINVTFLSICDIRFSSDDCKSLANIVSSNTCLETLELYECVFPTDGGRLFAHALINTTVRELHVQHTIHDGSFCEALLSSVPLNKSIETFSVHYNFKDTSSENFRFDIDLIKNVTSQNGSIRFLTIRDTMNHRILDEKDVLELYSAVRESFTLECIDIYGRQPFSDITRLNRAGRRYLLEDAASRLKCISVLAKVKNDLNCLYFHLRENPIVCMSYNNHSDENVVSKRREDESVDAFYKAKK